MRKILWLCVLVVGSKAQAQLPSAAHVLYNELESISSQFAQVCISALGSAGGVQITLVSPKNKFKIYPDPFTDQLTIETKNSIGKAVYIYDNMGVVRKKRRIEGDQIKINVSGLPKGIYFVEFGDQRQKFVKE
jgi:hypothetical protein